MPQFRIQSGTIATTGSAITMSGEVGFAIDGSVFRGVDGGHNVHVAYADGLAASTVADAVRAIASTIAAG